MPVYQDASNCYDPTADEYYDGYGCTIVSSGSKIPIATEFTESKQAPEETAMCVLEQHKILRTNCRERASISIQPPDVDEKHTD